MPPVDDPGRRAPDASRPLDLGFHRRPMVRWMNPAELGRSGLKVLLAGVFGAYADKREIQAGLRAHVKDDFDYSSVADRQIRGGDDLWFDFVADVGDGWNSTYTVARLLAAPALSANSPGGGPPLPRGRFLIMGGDEVYPVARRDTYEDRLVGPYRSALPWSELPGQPHLFALPGNHDWYDGLTAFTRLFCQAGRRWIGGWQAVQSRSYFAIKLAPAWWLYGIDIQLNSDVDEPQREYFEEAARRLGPGDHVIICTAEPSWLNAQPGRVDGYHNLAFFEEKIIRQHGGIPVLTLTGDLHHYARYASADTAQMRITAGGGGAFLHGTHQLERALRLPRRPWEAGGGSGTETLSLEASFPGPAQSRAQLLKLLLFPLTTPAFSASLGALFLAITVSLEASTRASDEGSLLQRLALASTAPTRVARVYLEALAESAAGALLVVLVLLGCIGLSRFRLPGRDVLLRRMRDPHRPVRWLAATVLETGDRLVRAATGLVHAAAQLTAWAVLLKLLVDVRPDRIVPLTGAGEVPWGVLLLFSAAVFVLGGLLGALVFALYLVGASLLGGCHHNDAFSALRIDGYKHFLRLHLDARGGLTVYPLGIRKVCRRWEFRPGSGNGAWFEPKRGEPDPRDQIELIDGPLHFDPRERRWTSGARRRPR
jgi:hypothetical protein